jgi:cellobiose phosphorylase
LEYLVYKSAQRRFEVLVRFDANSIKVYKVEPYVLVADIYANESYKGRGGWTWYTGSAGWMYQFIISSLIGIELKKDQLSFNPCSPLSMAIY